MSWLNIYLSEIFGNGCKRRTRSCNWIQWGPVTINIWLIIVRRHGGLCLLAQILCKSVVWYGAPNVSKYRGLSRANCILFVIFFRHLDFFDYQTRAGARAMMYQTVMYHPGPNSDTVPDKNGNDTINCGAKKVKDRKEIIISECTMPTQS